MRIINVDEEVVVSRDAAPSTSERESKGLYFCVRDCFRSGPRRFASCVCGLGASVYGLSVSAYGLGASVYGLSARVYGLGASVYGLSVSVYGLGACM